MNILIRFGLCTLFDFLRMHKNLLLFVSQRKPVRKSSRPVALASTIVKREKGVRNFCLIITLKDEVY